MEIKYIEGDEDIPSGYYYKKDGVWYKLEYLCNKYDKALELLVDFNLPCEKDDFIPYKREYYKDAIKEYLVSILNNNLIERFSDFEEVQFFKNHIKIIDKLNIRLNKYFSPDNFDTKYMKMINDTINLNK